jgi:hypothetical protein
MDKNVRMRCDAVGQYKCVTCLKRILLKNFFIDQTTKMTHTLTTDEIMKELERGWQV